jgi:hypothetical protein
MSTEPPKALEPVYSMAEPNAQLDLADGPLRMAIDTEPIPRARVSVDLRWQPTSQLHFQITTDREADLPQTCAPGEELAFVLPVAHSLATVSGRVFRRKTHQDQVIYEGRIPELSVECDAISRCVAHVVNFPTFMGSAVVFPTGAGVAGRASISMGPWQLTLDPTPDYSTVEDKLDLTGGFAITHTLEVQRADGAEFSSRQLVDLLDCLYWCFTLACGVRTAAILPVGFDSGGVAVFERWCSPRVDPWRSRDSFASGLDRRALERLISAFHGAWADPSRQAALRVILHWFAAVNTNCGGLEGSIVLAQAALESVASLMGGSTDRVWASVRIRNILARMQVPAAIPTHLQALLRLAASESWEDGPHAITGFRNSLTHTRRFEDLLVRDGVPVMELKVLATWYLELALLYLLGYDGTYGNRTRYQRGAWEREPVPWASR